MIMKMTLPMKQFTDFVIGLENGIIRDLEIQGHSDIFINRIMDKVESIIAYSGNLGKLVQQQNDGNFLNQYNATIEKQKSEIAKCEKQIKKLKKELSKYDPIYR